MNEKLKGKRVVVTGGANGIGRAIVEAFAYQGAKVFFNYKSKVKDAESLCASLRNEGLLCEGIRCALDEEGGVSELLSGALSYLGGIDVMVNNAAMLTRTSFLDTTSSQYDSVMNLNLKVPFFLIQNVAKHMIDRKINGSIINISSLSSIRARSSIAHYQVSKAGLEALTRSAAFELAPYGIRVNTICPGLTATSANSDQWRDNPELWSRRKTGIPLARAGIPEDHASAAVYFASEASSWVTGSCLIIDGGASIV